MLATKLQEKENETLEYKKSTSELKDGIISIASILTKHQKGNLYFGVKNDGEIVGQQVSDKTLREISQEISNFIEPKIYPTITEQVIEDKHIILVEFEGTDIPYSAYGIYRIRVSDEDKKVTKRELENIFHKNAAIKWDKEISVSTLKDIDDKILEDFYNSGFKAKRIKFKWDSTKDTITRFGLLSSNNLLNAGHIAFSTIADLSVKMGVFATDTKNTINDMNWIHANIYDALDFCETYFRNNTKWKVEFNDGSRLGFKREEIPEVPFKAIREALLNSFIHRDYLSPISNEFCIFKDRIEIFNPGEFNNKYKIEDYLNGGGASICRNELLANTIYLSEDIEAFGTGLKRINDLCEEADVKVNFVKDNVGFRVIFYRKNVDLEYVRKFDFKSLTEQEQRIILHLEEHQSITRKDVESILNIKDRRANILLNSLLEKEIIKFVGTKNSSKYELK